VQRVTGTRKDDEPRARDGGGLRLLPAARERVAIAAQHEGGRLDPAEVR
jgi:hypothetical protein